MKLRRSIIGLVVVCFTALAFKAHVPSIKLVEIVGKNGGELGFDSTSMNCNGVKGVYKLSFENSGYEKVTICPNLNDFPNIKGVINIFLRDVESGNAKDTIFNYSGFKVKLRIKDKGNFFLRIEQ